MESIRTSTLRLQAAARGLLVGTAVNARALRSDGAYRETLAREYNLLTPENEMKFGSIVQQKDVYNFEPAQEIVDFAKANDMRVRGHTLVWHNQNPAFLKPENYSRSQALDLLERHIFTTMGHFRGDIYAWDVVNEALESDGSLHETFWLKTIGLEYLEFAFRWAREADPSALLFYNEYAADDLGPKSNGMFHLLQDLKLRGIPVDGVGLQMHFALYDSPNFARPPAAEDLRANLERLAGLGLEIHITELDVQIQQVTGTLEERLEQQARVYADLMQVALESASLKAFVTWGFTDRFSWIPHFTGCEDAPLPFDEYYQPKPAYEAIYKALK
jgi:endo-1,4-beta-xylanase